ncbi:unnamed protein product [Mytilus coruscus]|uniref:Fucolectin tachylectin-4 pentraxin-1 domain-containing protein n=1 Tax=Mytilus coruscus TaxID=42192 RepID=A0A6J8A7G3_MYTCO|nr:unnamed protein product [Mytilus coruscus]
MLFVFLIHTTVLLTVIAQHNLTPFGNATQSSHITGGKPEYAIKPPISNRFTLDICSHTYVDRVNRPAWWMFQFSYRYAYITDITIYYREDSGSFSAYMSFRMAVKFEDVDFMDIVGTEQDHIDATEDIKLSQIALEVEIQLTQAAAAAENDF